MNLARSSITKSDAACKKIAGRKKSGGDGWRGTPGVQEACPRSGAKQTMPEKDDSCHNSWRESEPAFEKRIGALSK